MKNAKTLLKLAALTALLAVPVASQAAGISGTVHDFSGNSWGSTEICIFCHTPHNSKADKLAPLWNHASSSQTYTLYTSPTLNATMGQPAGASKACLSCHDGMVAIDSYGSRTGATMMDNVNGALVGADLGNDHPVSFTYDTALVTADGGLANTNSLPTSVKLFSGKVECATCHDVHDNSEGNFLVMDNAASTLCLTCHIK